MSFVLRTPASYVPSRLRFSGFLFRLRFVVKKKKKERKKVNLLANSFIDDRSGHRFSEHEPPDAAFATKFGSFRELEAAPVTVFGHFALARDSVAVLTIAPRQILQIEATSRHVVGAASVVRIFAI